MDFDLDIHTILLTIGGSRAYGIHTDSSDVDVKGVAIPPKEYLLGCDKKFDQAEGDNMQTFIDLFSNEELEAIKREKLEGTVYALNKFLKLAIDANPNILDVLFCRDSEIRYSNYIGEELRDNRDLFISAKCKHTFSGYAMAQLKRIRLHRKWLLNPPNKKPERSDYNLFEGVEKKQLDAALAAVNKVVDGWQLDLSRLEKSERVPIMNGVEEFMAEFSVAFDERWKAAGRTIGYSENFLAILDKEREFRSAVENWKQYNNWKKNRNEKRAALEAKYGYDCKHGAHLYRLLKMGREILETGKVNVWREDRDEILAIRNGKWPYEKLVEWAEEEDKSLTEVYKKKEYVISHKPDRVAINKLCVNLTQKFLSLRQI